MLALLAAIPVDEQFWAGLLAGAGLVCLPLVRSWSRDRMRWVGILKSHRSELTNLRIQVTRLNDQNQRLAAELEIERRRHPPGGKPGTDAGGSGGAPPRG